MAVLMGGPSSEHEVSLQGGRNVIAALPADLHEARPVVITRRGAWRLPPRRWEPPADREHGFDAHATDGWREHAGPCEAVLALVRWGVDVVFPVLHGAFGEDGSVQAVLAAAGVPFVGSDMAASAAAFDKVRAKEVFAFHGLPTPPFEVASVADLARHRAERVVAWGQRFGFPLVVKNPRGGSTLEVRVARDAGEAASAIEQLAPQAMRLMVEAFVEGRELTVGVLDERENGTARALPVVEIRTRSGGIFDYQEKYAADGAEEVCPASLDEEATRQAQEAALTVHRILGLRGLSRTDLILDRQGRFQVLEVNTLPGMTERGLVPLAARTAGIEFPTLVANLVRGARA